MTRRRLAVWLRWPLAAVAISAALFVVADWPGSPVRSLLKRWDGCVLDVYYPRRQVVVSQPGETAIVAFPMRNVSGRAITIYGIQSRCGCIRVEDLPIRLAPGEWKEVHFEIHTEGLEPGATISRVSRLYIDVPSPIVLLTVAIHVAAPQPSSSGLASAGT